MQISIDELLSSSFPTSSPQNWIVRQLIRGLSKQLFTKKKKKKFAKLSLVCKRLWLQVSSRDTVCDPCLQGWPSGILLWVHWFPYLLLFTHTLWKQSMTCVFVWSCCDDVHGNVHCLSYLITHSHTLVQKYKDSIHCVHALYSCITLDTIVSDIILTPVTKVHFVFSQLSGPTEPAPQAIS